MGLYKCIFFDLDHTLWDYETNSRETLHELFQQFNLPSKGIANFQSFNTQFTEVNFKLWDLYDRGLIDNTIIRNDRFKMILDYFGIHNDKLSNDLSVEYLKACPQKGNLMPGALEVLEYLSKKYNLTIITNGFEEIQHLKISSGKITHFFNHVITSHKAGHKKPSKEIFDFALKLNNAACSESIMIGDNLITDMGGARNASIDTVFFNPLSVPHQELVKHEIQSLKELMSFL